MKNPDPLSERERALRIELGKRTISIPSRTEREEKIDRDSPQVREIGARINDLIRQERLEEARDRLREALAENPDQPGLLNLQVVLDIMVRPFGNYEQARKNCALALETAVEQNNLYYTCHILNNMALIAHKEGHNEYSKAMYLAAHHIDPQAFPPMLNLAAWNARRGNLVQAQKWIERILDAFPDWTGNSEIVTFFLKDESLTNLRRYRPFMENVLSKISDTAQNG
jgi:tetratricopeptide (TPR) repeat protein